MKIGHTDSLASVTGVGSRAASGDAQKVASNQTTAPQDPAAASQVALSDAASALMQTGSSADFDAEKVARISKAIADGTFKVNHEAIADKLISNAQELLGKVST